jgi:hypothetical protein
MLEPYGHRELLQLRPDVYANYQLEEARWYVRDSRGQRWMSSRRARKTVKADLAKLRNRFVKAG